jgi:two-component system phosphate regulon response regulator PhoB
MAKPLILIVEDEEPLTLLLRYNLEAEGYEVEVSARGDDADVRLRERMPDLLILDWMLPGLSGIELCRRLRSRDDAAKLPILMLTARGEEDERIRGLATGADDYVVKPFALVSFVARVRALLRRSAGRGEPAPIEAGDLRLDTAQRRVWRGDEEVRLTTRQFDVLEFLVRRAGTVLTKDEILRGVWSYDFDGDPNIVEVYVRRLRTRIDVPFGRHAIETVRGAGYRLAADGG